MRCIGFLLTIISVSLKQMIEPSILIISILICNAIKVSGDLRISMMDVLMYYVCI